MRRDIPIAIVFVFVSLAALTSNIFAQQTQSECAQLKYSDHLTNPFIYRLNGIEGQAVYGDVSEKGEFQSASGVCVALFNQKNRRLVASVKTASGGQFKFENIAPGKYVLILSVSALHEITIPIEISNIPGAKGFKRWELLLHLRSKVDIKKSSVTPITEPDLRAQLIKLVEEDQDIRNEMIQKGADVNDDALDRRMVIIDSSSTARMKEIVEKYGWPGPDLVGRDGTEAAFLLVQHSPDLAFQEKMLPLVRENFEKGKLSAWNYALLQDRVLVREGKPQIYGMSVTRWAGKEPLLDPIEDEVNVDKRRAKIGLPPLREYLEFIKRLYFPK